MNRVSRPAILLVILLALGFATQISRVISWWPLYISFDLDDPVADCFWDRWMANIPKMGTRQEQTIEPPSQWAFVDQNSSPLTVASTESGSCSTTPIHALHIETSEFGVVVHHEYYEPEFSPTRGRGWRVPFMACWYTREAQAYQRTEWFAIRHIITVPVVAYLAFAFLRPPVRRCYRRRHGLCLNCGYNLTGLLESRCPECGTSFPARIT